MVLFPKLRKYSDLQRERMRVPNAKRRSVFNHHLILISLVNTALNFFFFPTYTPEKKINMKLVKYLDIIFKDTELF